MSRPSERCPACGKNWYPSESDVIHVILKRLRRGALPLRYYNCPHWPEQFHITHKRKPPRT